MDRHALVTESWNCQSWQELADHEASMLRPAAQGAPIPPPRPPKPA